MKSASSDTTFANVTGLDHPPFILHPPPQSPLMQIVPRRWKCELTDPGPGLRNVRDTPVSERKPRLPGDTRAEAVSHVPACRREPVVVATTDPTIVRAHSPESAPPPAPRLELDQLPGRGSCCLEPAAKRDALAVHHAPSARANLRPCAHSESHVGRSGLWTVLLPRKRKRSVRLGPRSALNLNRPLRLVLRVAIRRHGAPERLVCSNTDTSRPTSGFPPGLVRRPRIGIVRPKLARGERISLMRNRRFAACPSRTHSLRLADRQPSCHPQWKCKSANFPSAQRSVERRRPLGPHARSQLEHASRETFAVDRR